MTLNELLQTYKPDDVVCIGAASSYLYIGTVLHFYEVAEYLDNELLLFWQRRRAHMMQEIRRICFLGVRFTNKERPVNDKLIEEAQAMLTEGARRLGVAWADWIEADRFCTHPVPLRDRQVRQNLITPIDHRNQILVDGKEGGWFWEQYEFNAWEIENRKLIDKFYDDLRKGAQVAENESA